MIVMTSPRPRPTPRRTTAPPPVVPPPPAVTPPPAATPPLDTPPPLTPPLDASPAATPDAEYTETLVVPSQTALGVLIALVLGAILLALGLWPLAIVAVLAVAAVSVYLGQQILTVSPTRVSVAQGRGDKSPHTIELADVVVVEAVALTWPQCFGVGLPDTVDTTRFTVRAGPTLSLTMRDGEQVRISSARPEDVVAFTRR